MPGYLRRNTPVSPGYPCLRIDSRMLGIGCRKIQRGRASRRKAKGSAKSLKGKAKKSTKVQYIKESKKIICALPNISANLSHRFQTIPKNFIDFRPPGYPKPTGFSQRESPNVCAANVILRDTVVREQTLNDLVSDQAISISVGMAAAVGFLQAIREQIFAATIIEDRNQVD